MKVRGLWGLEIEPNKVQDLMIDASVKITMASICQFNTNSRTSIRMEFQGSSFLLCSLIPEKIEQQVVDITCLEGEKVVFRSDGPNGIHLMGNYISQSDTESETDESDVEERIEEDIPSIVQPSAVQKSNIKTQNVPIEIDDDDSEDFGVNENLRGFKLQSLEKFLDTFSNDDEADLSAKKLKAHEEPVTITEVEAEGHNSMKQVDVAEELKEEKSSANTKSVVSFKQVDDANIAVKELKKGETSANTKNVDSVKQLDDTATPKKDKVDRVDQVEPTELAKVINEQKCNVKSTRSKKKSKIIPVSGTLPEEVNKADTTSNGTDSQPPPSIASSKKSKAKKNKSAPPPTRDNKSNSASDKQTETKLKPKICATPLKDTKKEPAPAETSVNIEKNNQPTVEQPQEINESSLVKSGPVNKSGKRDATPEIAKHQNKSSNAKAKKSGTNNAPLKPKKSDPPTKDSSLNTNAKKLQLYTVNKKPNMEIKTSSTHQYLDTPPPILPSNGTIPTIVEPKSVTQNVNSHQEVNVYNHQPSVGHTKPPLKYPFAKSQSIMPKPIDSHGIPVVQTSAVTQEVRKTQWRQTSEGIPIVKTSAAPSIVGSSRQNVNTNNTAIPVAIPSAAEEFSPQQKRYPKRKMHEDSARNLQKLAAEDSHMEKMVASEKKKRRKNRHKSPLPYSSTSVAPLT